jgi:FkbM family methyltransferase
MKGNYMLTPYIKNDKVLVDDSCYSIGGCFNRNSVWEGGLIEEACNILTTIDNPVFFDIGANLGSFTLLKLYIPNLHVVAFEPFKKVAELLRVNTILNNIQDSVDIYEIALSNYKGESLLKCCYKSSGMSTLGEKFESLPYVTELVKVDTLDDFLKEHPVVKIDFMKMDTEGSELNILKGAEETIRKFKPIILVETVTARTAYFGYTPDKIIDQLKIYGYNSFEKRGSDAFARIIDG